LGVKVWIFKGEVFGDEHPAEKPAKPTGKRG
jgi:ribosomal protein S3